MTADIYDKDLLYDFLIDGFYRWIDHCVRVSGTPGRKAGAFDPKAMPRKQFLTIAKRTELISRIFCEKGLMALGKGDPRLADRLFTDAAAMLPDGSTFADASVYCALLKHAMGIPEAGEYMKTAKRMDPGVATRIAALASQLEPALKDIRSAREWAAAFFRTRP